MAGSFRLLEYPSSPGVQVTPEAYNSSKANYTFEITSIGLKFKRIVPICPGAPIPRNNFTCASNGNWVSNSSVTSHIVVNSPIQVIGNFSTSTITINGLNSTIKVDGCVTSFPSFVTVNLSPADLRSLMSSKSLSKTLITSDCSSTTGQSVSMTVGTTSSSSSLKGCQRLSGRLESRGTSMVGVFQLDSSRCNVWWIVLAAVLGSVLLIVIALVLIFSFVPSARRCIRPFIKRSEPRRYGKTTIA